MLVAADPTSDIAIGSMGLIDIHRYHCRAELGYWILPEHRRRGHVLRALNLMVVWSATWGIRRLQLTRLRLGPPRSVVELVA